MGSEFDGKYSVCAGGNLRAAKDTDSLAGLDYPCPGTTGSDFANNVKYDGVVGRSSRNILRMNSVTVTPDGI